MQIAEADGCSMSDLAGRLGADPSHVTRLVDRLEHAGFVARRQDASDRRTRVLDLTAAGQQVVQDVLSGMGTPPAGLVGLDEARLQALLELLREVEGQPERDAPEG